MIWGGLSTLVMFRPVPEEDFCTRPQVLLRRMVLRVVAIGNPVTVKNENVSETLILKRKSYFPFGVNEMAVNSIKINVIFSCTNGSESATKSSVG